MNLSLNRSALFLCLSSLECLAFAVEPLNGITNRPYVNYCYEPQESIIPQLCLENTSYNGTQYFTYCEYYRLLDYFPNEGGIYRGNCGNLTRQGDCNLLFYTDQCFYCPEGYLYHGGNCEVDLAYNPEIELAKNNNVCPAGVNDTDPIHSYTGVNIQQLTDFRDSNVFPLEFTRYYSSGNHMPRANLGINWRNNYSRYVSLPETSNQTFVTVARPNGDVFPFIYDNVSTQWIGEPDVIGKLYELKDGSGNRTGWQYTNKKDEVETYDVDGKLITLDNRAGVSHQLTYNLDIASGGDDNPDTVDLITHSLTNQTLELQHDPRGRLTQITLQPADQVYQYQYDSIISQLVSVIYPDDTPIDTSDNPTIMYLYNEPEQLTSGYTTLTASLTGIINENGDRQYTWKYNGERAYQHIEDPDNPSGPTKVVTITYNSNGTRTIQDSLGGTRTYHYVIKHGVALLSQVTGGPCLTCGYELQGATYDTNGFVSSRTDFEGNITTYINNSRGLETSRTEASGTPEARTIITEWHTTYRLPTKITEPGKETTFNYDANGNLLSRNERAL